MPTKFVRVYDTRTGRKHSVPADWLDHPRLGKFLKRTPSAAADLAAAGQLDVGEASKIAEEAANQFNLGEAVTD